MKEVKDLNEKYKLQLAEKDLENIVIHSSFQLQDNETRKKNKDLVAYGNKVARSLHAVFAYVNKKCSDEGELSILIASSYSMLIKEVYEKYQLIDYELVSAGELGNKHYDTSAKLIAIYYRTHGFIKTYLWLSNIMEKSCVVENHDYKTILQDYVQKRKLQMEYKIVGVEGPDNAPSFICELKVGNERILEKGMSKKVAQKAAAQHYVIKHNIPTKREGKIQRRFVDEQAALTPDRRKQILKIINTLQIKPNELPLEYLSAAFVHKSIQNDQKLKKNYADNSFLTVIGSELLTLFTYDYLMESQYYRYIDLTRESSAYNNSDTLRAALPDIWINSLISLSSVRADNLAGRGNLKKEILHSILAILVIYAVQEKQYATQNRTQKVAMALLKTVEYYRKADCITLLNEVSELLKFQIKREVNQKNGSSDHKPVFNACIKCWNTEFTISEIGEGTTKTNASNEAARKALLKLQADNHNNINLKKIICRELEPERYYDLSKLDDSIGQEDKEASDSLTEILVESLEKRRTSEFDEMELTFLKNLCL